MHDTVQIQEAGQTKAEKLKRHFLPRGLFQRPMDTGTGLPREGRCRDAHTQTRSQGTTQSTTPLSEAGLLSHQLLARASCPPAPDSGHRACPMSGGAGHSQLRGPLVKSPRPPGGPHSRVLRVTCGEKVGEEQRRVDASLAGVAENLLNPA